MSDRRRTGSLAPLSRADSFSPLPFPQVQLQEVRAPFSHKRLELSWQVAVEEKFPAGTVLYRLRRDRAAGDSLGALAAHLLSLGVLQPAGVGKPHAFRAPDAGIVTWLAPGGWRALKAGELLATYIPAADWEVFCARIEEQEDRLREFRRCAGAASPPEDAALSADLAAAREAVADLQRETASLARELQAFPRAAPPVPAVPADPCPPVSPEQLLLSPPPAADLAAVVRQQPRKVQEVFRQLEQSLEKESPLPVELLVLLGQDAVQVIQYADALAALDEQLATLLADPRLSEEEQELAAEDWSDSYSQLIRSATTRGG